jgi:hypothetical protein
MCCYHVFHSPGEGDGQEAYVLLTCANVLLTGDGQEPQGGQGWGEEKEKEEEESLLLGR